MLEFSLIALFSTGIRICDLLLRIHCLLCVCANCTAGRLLVGLYCASELSHWVSAHLCECGLSRRQNMHGFSTARCSPGIPSASVPSCRARARTLVPRISAAKDVMCKDVVNIRRRSAASMEGQATIVFAGVEGQEIEVQCPKVGSAASLCLQPAAKCELSRLRCVGYIYTRCWCRSRLGAALHMQGRHLWVWYIAVCCSSRTISANVPLSVCLQDVCGTCCGRTS